MQCEFLNSFYKDLNNLHLKSVRLQVAQFINEVESADNLSSLQNIKKLKGHRFAWRARLGDYRIGFFLEKHKVQFARIVHRKDIYKVFP